MIDGEANLLAAAKKGAHTALERLAADGLILSLVSYNHEVDIEHLAGEIGSDRRVIERYAIDGLQSSGTTAL